MSLFLVSKGADMSITNAATISPMELAQKLSNRFVIKLRDCSRCNNPTPIVADAPVVARKATVSTPNTSGAIAWSQHYNPLIDQIIIGFAEYVMLVRYAASADGAPSTRTAPFPETPSAAVQLCYNRLKANTEQTLLSYNNSNVVSSATNSVFKGALQTFKDTLFKQAEMVSRADKTASESLSNGLSVLVSQLTDVLVAREEEVIGKSFRTHMEKFVLSMKKIGEVGVVPDLVLDFVSLYRNVLVQLLFLADPEKSKNISDALTACAHGLRNLVASKARGMPHDAASLADIAANLKKMNSMLGMAFSNASALFKEEELEVFSSILAILRFPTESLPFHPSRTIKIFQSECIYIQEAVAAAAPDVGQLLNCALYIGATCSRLAKYATSLPSKDEDRKKWTTSAVGLLMQSANELILIACQLLARNKAFHYTQVGYALRAIACSMALIIDPLFYLPA